jgi:para-nitrobenzyl esterase
MNPIVETSYGQLRGTAEDGVEIFRGIPYARPPVGDLRFRPPAPLEPWTGVRDAVEFAAPAYQADTSASLARQFLTFTQPESSEDCLSLNVWTPAADGRRRPVMIWIHGGAYVTGSGAAPMYDGAALARNGDVVVVSLNYRLGAFGFLRLDGIGDEDHGATGNQGILDQVAAIRWVHEEIAAFGGDASNITVFGESAGAGSIATLLSMPGTTGLFQKAILQSGSANLVRTPEAAQATALRILQDLGIDPADSGKLRDVPAADLAAAQDRTAPPAGGLAYGPVTDGVDVPTDPFAAIAAGSASGVALLVGTNTDEMRFFGALDPAMLAMTEAQLLTLVTSTVGGDEDRAKDAIELYRAEREAHDEPAEPADIWFAIATDSVFRHPALRLAEIQSVHTSVFAYQFDWPSPAGGGVLRAAHVMEVPFVFGTYAHPTVRAFSGDGPEVEALSTVVQDAWVRFARFGSPITPDLPEWPPYDAGTRFTMVLGEPCRAVAAPAEAERAFWEAALVASGAG